MHDASSRRDFLRHTTQAAAAFSASAWVAQAATPGAAPQRLKVGQIGVGHAHAEGKMQSLRNSPDWEVIGVVAETPQWRAEVEQKDVYSGLPWLSQEQLLATPGLQAVAVETQVDRLLDVAQACINLGLPIHLDKPPGASLTQFKQLLQDANRQQLVVQLGYMYRYNPAIVLLRNLLAQGWLGDVFEVHAVMSKTVNHSKREKWAQFKGGVMFELGCHLVDLVVGVLGRPDRVTPYNRHTSSHDDALMDNMLAVCEYPRATATIRSTALEVEGGERRHLVVCGTEGTLHIQPLDNPAALLALAEAQGPYRAGYQSIALSKYERYVDDLADLAAIIRGEKAADFNSAHDLAVHETLLKACEMAP